MDTDAAVVLAPLTLTRPGFTHAQRIVAREVRGTRISGTPSPDHHPAPARLATSAWHSRAQVPLGLQTEATLIEPKPLFHRQDACSERAILRQLSAIVRHVDSRAKAQTCCCSVQHISLTRTSKLVGSRSVQNNSQSAERRIEGDDQVQMTTEKLTASFAR